MHVSINQKREPINNSRVLRMIQHSLRLRRKASFYFLSIYFPIGSTLPHFPLCNALVVYAATMRGQTHRSYWRPKKLVQTI